VAEDRASGEHRGGGGGTHGAATSSSRRARGVRSCRVALGSYPPRAPTDPDVQVSCIRLVRSTLHTRRYTE
jgi:hypothetical protein